MRRRHDGCVIGDSGKFGGCKLAAMCGDAVLVYARDDQPGLPFPGMLDLPGGGREGDETPEACVLRELAASFGVHVPEARLDYGRAYRLADGLTRTWFFALAITRAEVASVHFGEKGQDWAMMPAADFIAHDRAVPLLRGWVSDYRAATKAMRCLNTTSGKPGNA